VIQNRDDLIWKPFYLEKSIIEKSLLEWLQYEEPEAFLAKFTALFVEGNHEDSRVTQALEKVLFAPQEQQKFSQLIDYCCHLIIDRWLHNPESCQFIPKLIELFDLIKPQTKSYARLKGRLIQANKKYKETELYNRLEFIVKIITNEKTTFDLSEQMFVRDLVTKYHFLYRYFLREEISLDNEHKFILNKAKEKQQQFEFQLYKYVLYRTRLLQLARARQFSQGAGKVIRRIDNPTLLSDKDLKLAVDIYSSNFDCEYTLMQMAHKLLANNQHHSYGQFKQDLYRYLLLKIDFKNNDYPLNFYLKQKLEQIFPQSDKRPLNDSLILQTARQLLSFLMVEGDRTQVEPVRFMESIAHLGTAQTIMLLIKIVSICPQVKPDLELRLAMLFIHYQNDRVQDVLWLVKSLEHISVALGICFGKMDLSATKII
jgi:hypothetical protein